MKQVLTLKKLKKMIFFLQLVVKKKMEIFFMMKKYKRGHHYHWNFPLDIIVLFNLQSTDNMFTEKNIKVKHLDLLRVLGGIIN